MHNFGDLILRAHCARVNRKAMQRCGRAVVKAIRLCIASRVQSHRPTMWIVVEYMRNDKVPMHWCWQNEFRYLARKLIIFTILIQTTHAMHLPLVRARAVKSNRKFLIFIDYIALFRSFYDHSARSLNYTSNTSAVQHSLEFNITRPSPVSTTPQVMVRIFHLL